MARGRFISKVISLDEKVNALSNDTARLLFTWLIPHLDCEGRMHGDAQTVKSIVFPRRNISTQKIESFLKELEKFELILRYSVNGNEYLCAKNFEKHQPGLRKEKESQSQIPAFTPELRRSKDGLGLTQVKVKVKVKVYTYTVVFNYWNEQNIIIHKELTDEVRNVIVRTLRSYSVEGIKSAISNYAEILRGEEYYFKYKWTLHDFLKRGIEKFTDLEVAKSNFRKEGKDGTGKKSSRDLPTEYKPSPDYPDLQG